MKSVSFPFLYITDYSMLGFMNSEILKELANIVGKAFLLTSQEDLACYSYDGTGKVYIPDAVVLPDDVEQVASIMRLAGKFNFPVIPRGAGSGMTGGALPVHGGLIIAFSRMNKILEIDSDNMICVVEPGVITGELQKKLKKYLLMYPPDPASLKFCSLGGNAAECAGGPSAVKYGVTRDYIIGMEVVLPNGEIINTGARTEKSVVGYDLCRLFIGSEGTLGIFTKLILRLLPLPQAKSTFLVTLESLELATVLVARILAAGIMPCTLEYMDRTAITVVENLLTEPLGKNIQALLLIELDGSEEAVTEQVKKLSLFLKHKDITYRHSADEKEVAALWQARRSISPATFSLKPNKISEDVVVPRSRISDLVACTEQLSRDLDLLILTFGHAGDGNIHVNIMVDREDEVEYANGIKAREKLFEFVVKQGGSISGEHGIGTTKSKYMPLEVDANTLGLMKRLKDFFDPQGVLNPGKIF